MVQRAYSTSCLYVLTIWSLISTAFTTNVPRSTAAVQTNSPSLVLSKEHIVTDKPQERRYKWIAQNKKAAFDGLWRTVAVINNQFPGPLIEANEGDTIIVEVKNELDTPLSIHWHGIFQKGSPWMDGVSAVTQCPQLPGTTFTYRFTCKDQFGTFWYHAHYGALLSDGISGPMIIHSTRDPLVRGKDFDHDVIVFMNDWYHDTSTTITRRLLSTEGYNGSLAAPSPNSALINGVGFFDCGKYGNGNACQTISRPVEIRVPQGKIRMRLIQAGSHALFRVSVDRHPLKLIEADATPVKSLQTFHRIPIHNAERYSILLDTRFDKEGDLFYMRAAMDIDCFAWLAPGMDTAEGNTARAIIHVSNHAHEARVTFGSPSNKDWEDELGGPCVDLDMNTLEPLIDPKLNVNSLGAVYFNVSLGIIVEPKANPPKNVLARFFVDNTTWISKENDPLLPRMLKGGSGKLDPGEVGSQVIHKQGIWDVVINNLDNAIDHPIHLHGVDSCVVAMGPGALDQSNLKTAKYDLQGAICRDVHVIPGGSHMILRINANNPGVWILHCHIDWHLAAGFAGVLVIEPETLKEISLPETNKEICKTTNANHR